MQGQNIDNKIASGGSDFGRKRVANKQYPADYYAFSVAMAVGDWNIYDNSLISGNPFAYISNEDHGQDDEAIFSDSTTGDLIAGEFAYRYGITTPVDRYEA